MTNGSSVPLASPTPCRLCRGSEFVTVIADVPRLGARVPSGFGIGRCGRCGLMQTRPEPSGEVLTQAYGAAYTWQGGGGALARAEAFYRQVLVRLDQCRSLRTAAALSGGTRVLDVGCGDGLLIAEARRHGLEAFGVDRPGAPLWRECKSEWRQAGDIESLAQPAGTWDVVSLFHVAEHLRDPLDLFSRAHGWLKPGGVLLVQVPNAGSWDARWFGGRWYAYDIPRHLTHFTGPTLRRALETSGFRVVASRHFPLRDGGPCLVGSLAPGLDPLVERERALAAGVKRSTSWHAARRAVYLAAVWALTPVVLLEAAFRAAPVLTMMARVE